MDEINQNFKATTPAQTNALAKVASEFPTRTAPTPRVNPDSIPSPYAPTPKTFSDYESGKGLNDAELSGISTRYSTEAQGLTDAINAEFATREARQKELNASNLARVQVLNSKTGNTDSGTGSSEIVKENQKGAAALDAIASQRSGKIQAALFQIDNLKHNAIDKATATKAGDLDKYNALVEKNKTANQKIANEAMTSLANTGVKIDDLKTDKADPNDPNSLSTYDTLLQHTGLTPLELEAKYNAAQTAANKITYTYHNLGNGVTLRTGVTPSGAAVPEQKFNYTAPAGYDLIQTTDGQILFKNQKTGNIKSADTIAVGKEQTAPKSTNPKDTSYKFTNLDKGKLIGTGLSQKDVDAIQEDIKAHGAQAVLDGITDEKQKTVLQSILNGTKDTGA